MKKQNKKMSNRKKIPLNTESEVMYKSGMKCCMHHSLDVKGVHIHHIDSNKNNNDIDNLVFLCFDCHNEVSVSGNLSKKPSPIVIKKYRDEHYETIRIKIEHNRKLANNSVDNENNFDNITAAIALIEVAKIIAEIDKNESRNVDSINKIYNYFEYMSYPMAFKIANFCTTLSVYNDYNYAENSAGEVFSCGTIIIGNFINDEDTELNLDIYNQFLGCAFSIVYEAINKNNNFRAMCYGMQLIKFIYQKAIKIENEFLIEKVKADYLEIEEIINRCNNKSFHQKLTAIYNGFINDLENSSLAFPAFDETISKNYDDNKIDLAK
jgi:hypothetical protein